MRTEQHGVVVRDDVSAAGACQPDRCLATKYRRIGWKLGVSYLVRLDWHGGRMEGRFREVLES